MKQPIYTGQRCPVCGRPTIAIIDQVAGLPVTICINCDNTEAMKRFPRSTRWRISFQVWLLTTEAYGTWALLCTGLTMTALFVLMVGVEAGWRRLAVGGGWHCLPGGGVSALPADHAPLPERTPEITAIRRRKRIPVCLYQMDTYDTVQTAVAGI